MTKDKALRLAEEAIMDELQAVTAEEFEDAAGKLDDALRAIKKALEEPTIRENLTVKPVKREPVAYVSGYYNGRCIVKPIDEFTVFPVGRAFYTTPQPRQWVDLTDAEINEVYEKWGAIPYIAAIHTVIAAFKEKNNGN